MVAGFADNRDPDSLAARMRRERMRWFGEMIEALPSPVSILDVGGTASFWQVVGKDWLPRCEVTLLNLGEQPVEDVPGVRSVSGDARDLSRFAAESFDLCFSNSVIEHVGTLYDQRVMAREIARVARGYFVQTPYRHFPVEPHFVMPLWQYMPVALRTAALRRFNVGWMPKQPDAFLARAEVEQVRLLDRKELQSLFPDGTVLLERFGPFVKSLVARRFPRP